MDIAVVLGTRPQIIKSAPVIKKLASSAQAPRCPTKSECEFSDVVGQSNIHNNHEMKLP